MQRGDEAGFDFGGDVGVDVFDFVGDFVAESAGLADVGDGVGDHPGFVAVAKSVEDQAGHDGLDPHAGAWAIEIAVGGRAHGAAGEVRPAQELVFGGDEDVRVLVGIEVGAQQVDKGAG